MADPKFLVFAVPDDPAVLQALGVVAIRHGHPDHVLRMTIKTLAEVTPVEALDAGAGEL
jgi:L-ascorbate metabolism protein UlaG (beta-lactamase superfamily)